MLRPLALVMLGAGLITLSLNGCSRSGIPSTSSNTSTGESGQWAGYEAAANYAAQRGTVVYKVTYQPNAVTFDQQSTERALKDISADGTVYTLDASSPDAARLKPGSVLFLYGIAIRKVTGVSQQGSNLIVTTADADITDAIKQGHIQWQVPIDFSVIAASSLPMQQNASLEDLIASPAEAEGSAYNFEGALGPVDYELGFTPTPSRLNIELQATVKKAGMLVQLKGEGYVEHVLDIGEIDINDGQVAKMESAIQGVDGHIDFEWTAQNQLPGPAALIDQTFKVKIPGASLEVPFILGGLPFVFEASAAMIIHPAFTAKDEITTGKFAINYKGGEGFSYDAGAPEPEGNVTGTEDIDHSTSVVAIASMGFVAALELPRFELALAVMSPTSMAIARNTTTAAARHTSQFFGHRTQSLSELVEEFALPVKPYAFVDFVTSTGTFTNGAMITGLVALPPCQRAQVTVSANAGVGVKITFAHHLPLPPVLGHTASVEASEFAATTPIMKRSFTRYKNGISCPGD